MVVIEDNFSCKYFILKINYKENNFLALLTKKSNLNPFAVKEFIESFFNNAVGFFDTLKFTTNSQEQINNFETITSVTASDNLNNVSALIDLYFVSSVTDLIDLNKNLLNQLEKKENFFFCYSDISHQSDEIKRMLGRFNYPIFNYSDRIWLAITSKVNISFIVPAYNCAETITETIDSIASSNLDKSDEIIIIDDASSDKTKDVINQLGNIIPQIKIYNHNKNKGGAAARNTAASYARNPLVFCLDSDNLLTPHSVNELKYSLMSSNADMAAFSTLQYFWGDKIETSRWVYPKDDVIFEDIIASHINPHSSGNYLYTHNSWLRCNGYPEFSRALDAWGFGLRQAAHGYKFKILEDHKYLHRYGTESYMVRESKKGGLSLIATEIIWPFLEKLDVNSANYVIENKDSWFDKLAVRPLLAKSLINPKFGKFFEA